MPGRVALPFACCLVLSVSLACNKKSTGTTTPGPDGGTDAMDMPDVAGAGPNAASDAASDAAKPDVTTSDSRVDTPPDAGADTGAPDLAVCDHTLENLACWQSMVVGSFENPFSPWSTMFDGRYLNYLGNNTISCTTSRFDTTVTGPFPPKGAWTGFSADPSFQSLAFDGRYIYLLPDVRASLTVERTLNECIVQRFDPQTTGSTEKFSLTKTFGTATSPMPGFKGGAFDGRYLYLAPASAGFESSGRATRYDTQAGFASAAAWTTFDLTTLWPSAKGFQGGVFDGRYVYFLPYVTTPANPTSDMVPGGWLVRLDTTADFQDPKAWESFDLTTLDPAAVGFWGGTFDGRYVYLSPGWASTSKSIAVRFDTTATFAAASSFATFNLHGLGSGSSGRHFSFRGATFDGKYIYFSPSNDGDLFVRFDSSGDFTAKTAWQSFALFNLTSYSSFGAASGIAFDGRYVYLVSIGRFAVYRFDATATPSLPPLLTRSFL